MDMSRLELILAAASAAILGAGGAQAQTADTLEVLGEKISTGCVGGMPGNSGSRGPYRR